MSELAVVAIDPKYRKNHPKVTFPLPQHEFSLLLIAPKGSGKTNLICNLITRQFKGYFHRIIVVSPTVENDIKWEVVKKTKGILKENNALKKVLDTGLTDAEIAKLPKIVWEAGEVAKPKKEKFSGIMPAKDFLLTLDELLKEIEGQQEIISMLHHKGHEDDAKYIADRILVVIDDQAGRFPGGNNSEIVNYVIRHRHPNTSVIVATQANRAIPKAIRTNCNAMICFEIPNFKELETLYEEWPSNLSFDAWMEVYKYCTEVSGQLLV